MQRTCHGTESVAALVIVVGRGATPLHAIAAAVGCAVRVITAVVQEGKMAQRAIGVSTASYHHHCGKVIQHFNEQQFQVFKYSTVSNQNPLGFGSGFSF